MLVLTGILRFTRSDSHDLSSNERESGLGHDSPPSQETTLCARDAIELNEWSRIFPISKSETVMVGSSAQIKDNSEDDQTGNRENFNGSKHEFCFAVHAYPTSK